METIQQPAVKKMRINPGNINSAIKNPTPIRNQINDGEIIFNDIYLSGIKLFKVISGSLA